MYNEWTIGTKLQYCSSPGAIKDEIIHSNKTNRQQIGKTFQTTDLLPDSIVTVNKIIRKCG